MKKNKSIKYSTENSNSASVKEPLQIEFDKRKNWTLIPSDEIKKKIKVISLFSGSGGLDLGFLFTGKYEIVLANDFNYSACESYAHNIGNHIVWNDISKLDEFPKASLIIGGPPCQGFSTANPSRAFDDPRNMLFKEYSRILKQVKPSIFLMENVSGMVTMQHGKVFDIIKNEFEHCGYRLYTKLMNAKDYGVPQNRNRIIIIGIRDDITGAFTFPEPITSNGNYLTVGKTIIDNPIKEDAPNHVVSKLSILNQKRIKYIPQGGSMKNCPGHLKNNSDPKRSMRRLDSNKPSYTIVHNNCDHYYHPTENRRITIREMARLQGYPDEYIFFGSKSEQSRQVGNSVPIGLAKELAEEIYQFIRNNKLP